MYQQRRGDWCQTYTGRKAWPLDPRVEDFDILDIAHHLALQCRYAGAVREPYSVADHSLRVMAYVEERFDHGRRYTGEKLAEFRRRAALAALLHDAPEAYLVDMPRPLKHSPDLWGYRDREDRLARKIEQWAGLPLGALEWPLVKEADSVLLATEARDLMAPPPEPWKLPHAPLDSVIAPRSWRTAEADFMAAWGRLHKPLGTVPHYHSCPECYEKKPCTMGCSVEADFDDCGVPFGHHTICDDCESSKETP